MGKNLKRKKSVKVFTKEKTANILPAFAQRTENAVKNISPPCPKHEIGLQMHNTRTNAVRQFESSYAKIM